MNKLFISATTFFSMWLITAHAVTSSNSLAHRSDAHVSPYSEQVDEAKKTFQISEEYNQNKDYAHAIDWMRRSADLGYPAAMFRMIELYSMETEYQDYQAAYKWAVLYMLHTKIHSHVSSLLPWLSLNEMEAAHLDVIAWLESKKISEITVNGIRRQLADILKIAERENLAVSEMSLLYNDISWIFITAIIMSY